MKPWIISRRTFFVAAGIAGALALATLFWQLSRPTAPHPPTVVAHDYSGRATACLAADSATAAHTEAVSTVWSAIQSAGNGAKRNVQKLIMPATGPDQAQPYLASLVSQRCDLIITIGAPFGQAVPALAKLGTGVQFTVVDAGLSQVPAGVTALGVAGAAEHVHEQVQALQHSRPSPLPTAHP